VLERACHAGVLPNVVTRRVASNRARLPIPTRAKVGAVVDRAKAVHQYLLASGPNRANLGWLAVSSEDDLPHRPVNIAATAHVQGEIPVRVWGIDMTLRYARTGDLTATSKNVLLLHGHSSRLEEVEHLMTELAAKGYVVIALDLPSNGCSSQIAHADVLFAEHPVCGDVPIPYEKEDQSLDNHSSLYVLRFLQATVHELVVGLFAEANLPPRIDLLAGGSLGGNLGLLISEAAPFGNPGRHARVNADLSWVRKIASWSPACLWDQPGLAAGTPHGRSLEHETPDRRRDHINRWMNVDHVGPVVIRQAEQWYRKGWADKRRAIAESWLSRHEFYSPRFRQWHWIVAHEQVKFSHQDEVRDANGNGLGKKHYELLGGELLLMAGDGDNFPNTNIFDRVKELAPKMPAKGKALLWKDTGHSIHDERPKALADVLDRFVKGTL
jgi:pimeloyl-ACP methyl ester carboxylesterase